MTTAVLCLPEGAEFYDPAPEETARRSVELVRAWDGRPAAVIGWSDGGYGALELAARHPDMVDRLILVAVPAPEDRERPADIAQIRAKTLLLFGNSDSRTGSAHGRWWQKQLQNSRLEMVPGGGHDLLRPMWGRILAHAAPGRHQSVGR